MASRRDSRMTLTPTGPPPESRGWGWCPRHAEWVCTSGSRLCNYCRTPLVRLPRPVQPRPGELRPGVVAEFADTRDRFDPTRALAELRARLAMKVHETRGQ
jgi:hypothetical protein